MHHVRDFIPKPSQTDIPLMKDIYRYWANQDEWLLLEGTNFESGEKQRIAVKCSKRGNDVFNDRLEKRLGFLRLLEDQAFFNSKDVPIENSKAKTEVQTKMLWVTFTSDPSLKSLDEAWRSDSHDWNLMITKLRKRYGKISVLQFIEAFPDNQGLAYGYPHHHAVLFFHETKFNVFLHYDKDPKGEGISYRIRESSEVKTTAQWDAFVDIKALRTMDSVIDYCRKHEEGSFVLDRNDGSVNNEALMNCTLGWFYHKRTFSVSQGFREALSDLIRHLRNSNRSGRFLQTCVDGSKAFPVVVWECLGVRSWLELEKVGLSDGWVLLIEDPDVWERLVRRDYFRERLYDD